jgi:hypothetical protein
MGRPTIPHGKMTVRKARQRWEAVRIAAQEGDPGAMLDAVSRFQCIAETMFQHWDTYSAPTICGAVEKEE